PILSLFGVTATVRDTHDHPVVAGSPYLVLELRSPQMTTRMMSMALSRRRRARPSESLGGGLRSSLPWEAAYPGASAHRPLHEGGGNGPRASRGKPTRTVSMLRSRDRDEGDRRRKPRETRSRAPAATSATPVRCRGRASAWRVGTWYPSTARADRGAQPIRSPSPRAFASA